MHNILLYVLDYPTYKFLSLRIG